MSEGKGQIVLAQVHPASTMGINSKTCCPVVPVTSTTSTCVSQALTQEKICQSYEMLKYLSLTQNEPTIVGDSCDGEVYLPWRRFEPSDVQLDFHRPPINSRFSATATESVTGNHFSSIGRPCPSADSDHDSMKCLNTCCYRLPTLPEGVSVGETDLVVTPSNASLPVPRVPSTPDVVANDILPPPWKTVETEPPEIATAAAHGATLSSRTQSEQNSGPLYITDSTCHCTWTGTGAAHYRGSRRNSLVPTATGSSRRRCSQPVTSVERVAIFDGDDDEALMIQGRAQRSWSWLLDSPMTVEEDEVRTRRNSFLADHGSVSSLAVEYAGNTDKGYGGGTTSVAAACNVGVGSTALSDHCLLPTAMQLLLARSHSACDLTETDEQKFSSWPRGDQLQNYASVPNLAFI